VDLYLVQHGEATTEAENPQRPLTPKGREDIERVAAFLSRAAVVCRAIRHRGKRRAAETAAIFQDALDVSTIEAVPGLSPNDDVHAAARDVSNASEPLMLVGHLPFLSRLAGLLVAGDPAIEVVRFQMGGAVCLQREGSRWTVRWAVTPDLLR